MSFIDLLPRFLACFVTFWGSALLTIFTVGQPGGGSDPSLGSVSAAPLRSLGSLPSESSLAAGPTDAFNKDTIPFAMVITVTDSGWAALKTDEQILRYARGRAYAEFVGPFTVEASTSISRTSSIPAAQATVAVCIAPSAPSGCDDPTTISQILAFPGSAFLVASHTSASGPQPIAFGPMLHTNLFSSPAFGSTPYLYYASERYNAGVTRLIFRGNLQLAGIGYNAGFFPATPAATQPAGSGQ